MALFRIHGKLLAKDGKVRQGLDELRHHSALLQAHMTRMELGTLCANCAAMAMGGCCSSIMAAETDSIQLCINLLAGIDVRRVNNEDGECCYLGPAGCIFQFKPMFCLNYNCHGIRQKLSISDMQNLETLAGRLLGSQYQLENTILKNITWPKTALEPHTKG